MGMNSWVKGFIPPDEKWKQMKAVWDACKTAGTKIPIEVIDFFNDCPPDPAGVVVDIPHTPWGADMQEGFEVDIRKLPKDVVIIRFVNSY